MPELPDVEIAKRRLDKGLRGATVTGAHCADRYVLRPAEPRAFERALVGRKIRAVERRGKWLRILLDDGERIFSHLGMTGWWIETDTEAPPARSERARIDAARRGGPARSFRYQDSRRFGRLIPAKGDIAEWRELGPDPLADGVDVAKLAEILGRSRRAVKEVLMDQTALAGIGNILATEALWHARIDPRSRADALSRTDVGKVSRGLDKAIRDEIATRERSRDDEWRDVFAIYGHASAPCPRCGTTIGRVVIAGRTTAFCRHCQIRRGPARKKKRSPPTR
jgi:formamidopyrimidine-DNA glycosylase